MTILPPLDEDCPDCTGPEADARRRENADAWHAWNAEEQGAYSEFASQYDRTVQYGGAYEAWAHSDRCRELMGRQPEELPQVGCIECDYTGRCPTEAGRQILAFLTIHQREG